jgi:intracellular sulfur oxidation DsrE/DsrF family protein
MKQSLRKLRVTPQLRVTPLWLALSLFASFFLTVALTGSKSADPASQASSAGTNVKHHRVVFQVNSNDPEPMRHTISNVINATKHYQERNETVDIEIVAYGPGVHMFRSDTSPVKELLPYLLASSSAIKLTVCGNTKQIMELKEGHDVPLVEGATVVPSGIVRVIELQEAGWSYVRP